MKEARIRNIKPTNILTTKSVLIAAALSFAGLFVTFDSASALCPENHPSCNLPPPPPPPKPCPSLTGAIFPKYYVLGLVYAPPGCTSTAGAQCSGQSSVNYSTGSSMGTKISTSASFNVGVDVSVDTSFGIPIVGQLTVGVSGGYSTTSSDSTTQTVTKSQSLEIAVSGSGDGVNHNADYFILLLNPAVALTKSKLTVGARLSNAPT